MRGLVTTVAILGLTTALAGCSGGSSPQPKQTATSSTTPPVATTASSGVTWKYLQTQYSKFLGNKCEYDAEDPAVRLCVGLQHADLQSFARDAQDLPRSKARADLLGAIDSYEKHYAEWDKNNCQGEFTLACTTKPGLMDMSHSIMVTIVEREAANE